MQVFKASIKIAKRKMHTIIVYFLIYGVLCMLMAYTGDSNVSDKFQAEALEISIIDRDNSDASRALTEYLGSIHNLIELPEDEEVIQDNLYYNFVQYVLFINEGFEKKLLNQETEGLFENVTIPESASGEFAGNQVEQYVKSLQIYLAGGYGMEEAIEAVDTSVEETEQVTVRSFGEQLGEKQKNVTYFYQYHPYIFIVLLICGLGNVLIILNEKEIYNRTISSGISLTSRNLQMGASVILYSLITWILFFLLGILLYGEVMFSGESLYSALNSGVFLVFVSGITLLITNFSPSLNVLNMLSNVIGLGMSFLCGVFVPQSMLGAATLKAARFLPAYWYIKANNMIGGLTEEAFSEETYWVCIGVQLLFAAAAFTAALMASKLKKRKTV